MIIRILLAIPALIIPAHAAAQERAVPAAREQIQLSFAPVVRKVAPAVVNIYTKRVVARAANPFMTDPFFAPFFQDNMFGGQMRRHVESSLGSGVIVEPGGLVVTNTHVINRADEITVVLADGREFDATLLLKDPGSDLALLRVDSKGEALPFAPLKPSESLQVGDLVLAIGNPFGVGQTVTSGIVSALARSSLNINDFNFFIQTDAAINPGNSGGPLVALDGGVVGINTAIFSKDGGSLGIGFAIPSEMVATVIAAEKTGQAGKQGVSRAWLGITAQNVTSDIANSLGLKRPGGALVAVLHPASPLLKAGLKVGDVVTAINSHEIRDASEMKFRMATLPIGGTATLTVSRQGRSLDFSVVAALPPDDPPRAQMTIKGRHPLGGAVIVNINPAVAAELGLSGHEDGAVAVMAVTPGSAAARLLNPGDILLEINGRKIFKTADVEPAAALSAGRGISLLLSARGRTQRIVIR